MTIHSSWFIVILIRKQHNQSIWKPSKIIWKAIQNKIINRRGQWIWYTLTTIIIRYNGTERDSRQRNWGRSYGGAEGDHRQRSWEIVDGRAEGDRRNWLSTKLKEIAAKLKNDSDGRVEGRRRRIWGTMTAYLRDDDDWGTMKQSKAEGDDGEKWRWWRRWLNQWSFQVFKYNWRISEWDKKVICSIKWNIFVIFGLEVYNEKKCCYKAI